MTATIEQSVGQLAGYITAKECADRYRMSLRQWYRMVDAGFAPKPRKFGVRLVRWSLASLNEWDAEQEPQASRAR